MRQRRKDGGGWRRGACLLLVVFAFAGSRAYAEQDAAGQKVEKLAADAVAAYKAADYAHTIELLELAYGIRPVAALLYNLAKAYEKLGDQEKSTESYRRYVISSDAEPKLRAKAEARITAYEESRHAVKDPHPEDSELHPRLDATPDPRPITRPSKHEPPKPIVVETPAERAAREWKARRHRDRVVGLTLGSLGVASVLSAIGLSVSALELHNDYADNVGLENDRRAERDNARDQALASDVLYGVAAVSAGVGAYFLWRGYRREEGPRVTAVAPIAAPGVAGAMIGGAF